MHNIIIEQAVTMPNYYTIKNKLRVIHTNPFLITILDVLGKSKATIQSLISLAISIYLTLHLLTC